jgi:RNA polymerase sigma factor
MRRLRRVNQAGKRGRYSNAHTRKETMHSEIDRLAIRAATDERAREQFIQSQERVILKIASRAAHRFVTKSDDEWSVALYAFSRAVDTFRADKGPFLAYADAVIRRSLIDEFRKQTRHSQEIAVPPHAFDGSGDEAETTDVQYAVVRNSIRAADAGLKDEIAALATACKAFGFGFSDLMKVSPRQDKTRNACACAVRFLLSGPDRIDRLYRTHQLPTQALADEAGVSKKILDRYRKYIITATIVLTGDYPELKEYFTFI